MLGQCPALITLPPTGRGFVLPSNHAGGVRDGRGGGGSHTALHTCSRMLSVAPPPPSLVVAHSLFFCAIAHIASAAAPGRALDGTYVDAAMEGGAGAVGLSTTPLAKRPVPRIVLPETWRWDTTFTHATGLQNDANLCYMNSIFQVLRGIRPLCGCFDNGTTKSSVQGGVLPHVLGFDFIWKLHRHGQ